MTESQQTKYRLYNVGPTSSLLVQHCKHVIQMFCVYWGGAECYSDSSFHPNCDPERCDESTDKGTTTHADTTGILNLFNGSVA